MPGRTTVTSLAPTCAASASASSAVALRGDDHAARRAPPPRRRRRPATVARQSDSRTVIAFRPARPQRAARRRRTERARRGRSCRSRGARARRRRPARPAVGGPALLATTTSLPNGEHAVVRRRPPRDRGRRDRRRGERLAPHRAAAIDEQAQRGRRLRPRRGPAAGRGRRPRRPPRASAIASRLASTIEVAAVGPVRQLDHLPMPRGFGRATAADVEEQPSGEPPGQLAQPRVGRRGEIGEQRQHVVGVLGERLVDGGLVELADLGRDLLEARVAGELATRRGPLARPAPRPRRPRRPPSPAVTSAGAGGPSRGASFSLAVTVLGRAPTEHDLPQLGDDRPRRCGRCPRAAAPGRTGR